ncbi:MAG: hypothetical protein NC548_27805 [Lachnospiraceae bacterium]|nr:hypothetical protein [Lachnospiraceae bacterium]
MDVMSKSEISILHLIADEVDKILRSKNSPSPVTLGGLTRLLERSLPQLTMGKTIKVEWDVSKPMEPYIMAMYPDPEELHKKSKVLFDELVNVSDLEGKPSKSSYNEGNDYLSAWCEIQHWQLFIDVRLVDPASAISVTTGDQFSAILAHEIGHVMNGDPIQLLRTYRENLYQQSRLERMMLSRNFFVRKIALPIFVNTLQFRMIIDRPDSVAEEVAADGYIPDEFRGAMIDYVTNRLLKTTAGSRLVITREEYKAQHRTAIKYHRSTVIMLTKRRDILKRRLNAQYNNPSMNPYLKNLLKFCATGVTGFNPEDAKEDLVAESNLTIAFNKEFQRVTETVSPILEAAKVTDRDITMLELDIADIKNSDDKLWCIQTIYDYIDIIEKDQAKKEKDAAKKGVVLPKELKKDPRLEKLWKLRNQVMNMKVSKSGVGPQYGVYIQYPKGYEG